MFEMNSPFEELEQLADILPEEGESVLLTRRDGELVCETYRPEPSRRDPLDDPVLYGRLIQSNERLRAALLAPIWWSVALLYLGGLAVYLLGFGWSGLLLDIGLILLLIRISLGWCARRREVVFRTEIRPMLTRILRLRGTDRHSVLASVGQRPELRQLYLELARWYD